MQYEETEDRKILKAREVQVVEVRSAPAFYIRLSDGTTLEYNGTVTRSLGARANAPRQPLTTVPAEELSTLIATTPLSWVVFNTGNQRIMFSNSWLLTMKPDPDDTWRLDLADGRVLTYPPE